MMAVPENHGLSFNPLLIGVGGRTISNMIAAASEAANVFQSPSDRGGGPDAAATPLPEPEPEPVSIPF